MHVSLPIITLSFLLGACAIFWLVPSMPWLSSMLVLAIILILLQRKFIPIILACVLLGYSYAAYHVHLQHSHILAEQLEGVAINVSGTIASVVETDDQQNAHFIFQISTPADLAKRVRLTWYRCPHHLEAGDVWQLSLKLKRPRGLANPAGFDSDKYNFQQRICAVGYVYEKNVNNMLLHKSWTIDRLRQIIWEHIRKDREFAGIATALLLGIKSGISDHQELVLQNTGTAHLMAIAGVHVGFVAGMGFCLVWLLWRVLPSSWLVIPMQHAATCFALLASIIYAFLAGFSVATQRALIMLVIILGCTLLKREASRLHTYCLALLAVLMHDPLEIMSIGFWLSFWAVACLLYAFVGRGMLSRPWRWLQPQLVIGFGLLPLSLLFFQQNSLVGPIANMLAIPWVGFTVIPMCFIGLFGVANFNLSLLWPVLEYLNDFPVYHWTPPSDYLLLRMALAAAGFAWLFAPRGIPGRYWGVLGFVPLFISNVPTIPRGQADFTLLDVGQGLAAVVRTQNHTLVFDTGVPGLGKMVIAPFLHSVGAHSLDTLIISHADNDHSGGAAGLLQQMPAKQIITSALDLFPNSQPCLAGQHWQWDSVEFMILHPELEPVSKKRNDISCVLLVQAGDQRVLITADIEEKSERELIAKYGNDLQAEVLIVPHHGSRTSSSEEFIDKVNPVLALIPVGYKSRYGHPKPQILERYMRREIPIFTSEHDGAISLRLGSSSLGENLRPHCYRAEELRPFWRID